MNPSRVLNILGATAMEFGVSLNALLGPRRYEPLATARQVAMFLIREDESRPYLREVSALFGRRSIATAWTAWSNIRTWIRIDARVSRKVAAIQTSLRIGTDGE